MQLATRCVSRAHLLSAQASLEKQRQLVAELQVKYDELNVQRQAVLKQRAEDNEMERVCLIVAFAVNAELSAAQTTTSRTGGESSTAHSGFVPRFHYSQTNQGSAEPQSTCLPCSVASLLT